MTSSASRIPSFPRVSDPSHPLIEGGVAELLPGDHAFLPEDAGRGVRKGVDKLLVEILAQLICVGVRCVVVTDDSAVGEELSGGLRSRGLDPESLCERKVVLFLSHADLFDVGLGALKGEALEAGFRDLHLIHLPSPRLPKRELIRIERMLSEEAPGSKVAVVCRHQGTRNDEACAANAGSVLRFHGKVLVEGRFCPNPFFYTETIHPDSLADSLAESPERDGFAALLRGISRFRESERKKEEAQDRSRLFAEAIPHLVWTQEAGRSEACFNRQWEKYLGAPKVDSRPLREAANYSWLSAVDPADRVRCEEIWRHCLATGEALETEARMISADGSSRWHIVRAEPTRNEAGQPTRWVGTCTDVNERVRAQEFDRFLAEAQSILASSLDYEVTLSSIARLIVPQLADWCLIQAGPGRASPRTLALVHRDPEKEGWGRSILESLSGSDEPGNLLEACSSELKLRAGPISANDLLFDCPKKRDFFRELGIFSYMCIPLKTREGNRIGSIFLVSSCPKKKFGPSELALASELGNRAANAIEHAILYRSARQAVEARDEFLSIASHELKTPLTSMRIQHQMIVRAFDRGKMEALPWGNVVSLLKNTDKQVVRLGELVEDLLDVVKIDSGKLVLNLTRFDPVEAVQSSLTRMASRLAEACCPVETELETGLEGRWDRPRLERVVDGLLLNAMKYGPGKPIQIRLGMRSSKLCLQIADQGIGIRDSDLSRIFGRYERAVSAQHFGGLGLGLFIARQIVVAHGGEIYAESKPGQGSCFVVELPR